MCEHCGVDDCIHCSSLEKALQEDDKLWAKPAWEWEDEKRCICQDWTEQIENLYAIVLQAKLAGLQISVKLFKFCPWCGKLRRKENDERNSAN